MRDWFLYLIVCLFLTLTFVIVGTENYYANTTNTVSSTVTGTTTVDKSPSTASAPTIINNNNDICKVGIGGSVQNNVLGVATGILVDDELCQILKLSRSQYAYGMKVSAVALLCQDARVWDSMLDAGTPCPARGFIGAEAAKYWEENPDQIPEGSRYKPQFLQTKVVEEKLQGDWDDIKDFGLMALTMLLIF
jgi:hypothetical protein